MTTTKTLDLEVYTDKVIRKVENYYGALFSGYEDEYEIVYRGWSNGDSITATASAVSALISNR